VIKKKDNLITEIKQGLRGGAGAATLTTYLGAGDMPGISTASIVTLAVDSSIGQHTHEGTAELYLLILGSGRAWLDGVSFPVEAGDAFIVRSGHSHGLDNTAQAELKLVAVITPDDGVLV
jgi:mannose-6-phosphate isomerase-like protein (cupin superfamily)